MTGWMQKQIIRILREARDLQPGAWVSTQYLTNKINEMHIYNYKTPRTNTQVRASVRALNAKGMVRRTGEKTRRYDTESWRIDPE